jgi:hypothetical protein
MPLLIDDDEREYYKREDHEARMDALGRPDNCDCGGEYVLALTTTYGDDADGRRGVPLRVWECNRCGNEQEIAG